MTSAARKRLLDTMRALLPYLPANSDADPAVRDGRLDVSNPARGAEYFQRKTPFAWLTFTALVVWLCAFILFPGLIASATAGYSAPLERALPAAVAAEPPIYAAPLTTAQPGWLIRALSGAGTISAAFSASGYTLTGADQTLVSPAPRVTMADGAALATVNLTPEPGEQDDYNAAGLLLDAPSGAAGMVFEIQKRWLMEASAGAS
jgi:hypothetical protein